MKAKYINEKFDETSDPIKDMGKKRKLYLELIPLGSYTRCKNEYYNLSKLASNEHTWKKKYIWARSTQDIDTWIEFFDIMG